jgi:hypothetical protein
MKMINKRLRNQRALAPPVSDVMWGGVAHARDEILHLAGEQGESSVGEMKRQLDELGPDGLWREVVQSVLADHGFVAGR